MDLLAGAVVDPGEGVAAFDGVGVAREIDDGMVLDAVVAEVVRGDELIDGLPAVADGDERVIGAVEDEHGNETRMLRAGAAVRVAAAGGGIALAAFERGGDGGLQLHRRLVHPARGHHAGGEDVGVARQQDAGHVAAGGDAEDVDARAVDGVARLDPVDHGLDRRRLAGAALLVLGEEPVPAAHRVRRRILARQQDEHALAVGEPGHAREAGEVAGRLRAAVNGHDERALLALGVAVGHVEFEAASGDGRGQQQSADHSKSSRNGSVQPGTTSPPSNASSMPMSSTSVTERWMAALCLDGSMTMTRRTPERSQSSTFAWTSV